MTSTNHQLGTRISFNCLYLFNCYSLSLSFSGVTKEWRRGRKHLWRAYLLFFEIEILIKSMHRWIFKEVLRWWSNNMGYWLEVTICSDHQSTWSFHINVVVDPFSITILSRTFIVFRRCISEEDHHKKKLLSRMFCFYKLRIACWEKWRIICGLIIEIYCRYTALIDAIDFISWYLSRKLFLYPVIPQILFT